MNPMGRAALMVLIDKWPTDKIPLTRKWLLHCFFLVDKYFGSSDFGIQWHQKYMVPYNEDLIKDLDHLGCLNILKRGIDKDIRQKINQALDEKTIIAINMLLSKLLSYSSLGQAYELQGISSKILGANNEKISDSL